MAERASALGVFFIFTANDMSKFPVELVRRFDLRMFVDLPSSNERDHIFRLKMTENQQTTEGIDMDEIVRNTNEYSGSDIEQVVEKGMSYAYRDGRRPPTTEDYLQAIDKTVPTAHTYADQIDHMKKWVKDKTMIPANSESISLSEKESEDSIRSVIWAVTTGLTALEMSIKWSMKDLGRLFGPEEVFSAMTVYDEFKNTENYKDNLNIGQLLSMRVKGMTEVPESGMRTLHSLFDKTVEDFSVFVKDPSIFADRVKTGFKNPVDNLSSEPMFRDAVRIILLFTLMEDKKMIMEDAKQERDRIINRVMSVVSMQLENILGGVAKSLISAKENMDLTDLDVKRLSLRVIEVFEDGLETQLMIDGIPIENDSDIKERLSKEVDSNNTTDRNNPMYG